MGNASGKQRIHAYHTRPHGALRAGFLLEANRLRKLPGESQVHYPAAYLYSSGFALVTNAWFSCNAYIVLD
jgi:hypothetical protein